MPIGIDELARASWERDDVHKLFDNLQFRVLRDRLFATLSAPAPEAEDGFEIDLTRLETGAVADWLDAHARDGRRVGLSFRGSWGRASATSPASRWPSADGAAAYLRARAARRRRRARRSTGWLADPALPKAAHDVKGPLLALGQRGWTLAGLTSDTQLAAYLALPGQRSFDLADLALRYLHRELRAVGPKPRPVS